MFPPSTPRAVPPAPRARPRRRHPSIARAAPPPRRVRASPPRRHRAPASRWRRRAPPSPARPRARAPPRRARTDARYYFQPFHRIARARARSREAPCAFPRAPRGDASARGRAGDTSTRGRRRDVARSTRARGTDREKNHASVRRRWTTNGAIARRGGGIGGGESDSVDLNTCAWRTRMRARRKAGAGRTSGR